MLKFPADVFSQPVTRYADDVYHVMWSDDRCLWLVDNRKNVISVVQCYHRLIPDVIVPFSLLPVTTRPPSTNQNHSYHHRRAPRPPPPSATPATPSPSATSATPATLSQGSNLCCVGLHSFAQRDISVVHCTPKLWSPVVPQ